MKAMIRSGMYILRLMPPKWRTVILRKISYHLIDRHATIRILGKEKLETLGEPVIFVSNHLSNIDGLILYRMLEDQDVTFLAGVKLRGNWFNRVGLSLVPHIPIRAGQPDREAIKRCVGHLKNNRSLFIFPEGTRSRNACLIHGKRGIELILRKTGVRIVPLGITGTQHLMPINDHNMAGEWFRNAEVDIRIGDPLELREGEGVDRIMYAISQLLPPEYRGVYSTDSRGA
ncbi:lysophospholipid acyltransferase family protein [Salinithrix halophila]|uniref:Lysophospholipid acyltransferase family protein n=1 Tax=Salinithrix halophila TaxID=1485204 RepID=A0ABV8JEK3_9BACL